MRLRVDLKVMILWMRWEVAVHRLNANVPVVRWLCLDERLGAAPGDGLG